MSRTRASAFAASVLPTPASPSSSSGFSSCEREKERGRQPAIGQVLGVAKAALELVDGGDRHVLTVRAVRRHRPSPMSRAPNSGTSTLDPRRPLDPTPPQDGHVDASRPRSATADHRCSPGRHRSSCRSVDPDGRARDSRGTNTCWRCLGRSSAPVEPGTPGSHDAVDMAGPVDDDGRRSFRRRRGGVQRSATAGSRARRADRDADARAKRVLSSAERPRRSRATTATTRCRSASSAPRPARRDARSAQATSAESLRCLARSGPRRR